MKKTINYTRLLLLTLFPFYMGDGCKVSNLFFLPIILPIGLLGLSQLDWSHISHHFRVPVGPSRLFWWYCASPQQVVPSIMLLPPVAWKLGFDFKRDTLCIKHCICGCALVMGSWVNTKSFIL
jgi:hypothetical protein